jgi:hypothetical protein
VACQVMISPKKMPADAGIFSFLTVTIKWPLET